MRCEVVRVWRDVCIFVTNSGCSSPVLVNPFHKQGARTCRVRRVSSLRNSSIVDCSGPETFTLGVIYGVMSNAAAIEQLKLAKELKRVKKEKLLREKKENVARQKLEEKKRAQELAEKVQTQLDPLQPTDEEMHAMKNDLHMFETVIQMHRAETGLKCRTHKNIVDVRIELCSVTARPFLRQLVRPRVQVCSLDLSHLSLDDGIGTLIGHCLRRNNSLQTLDLAHNRFTYLTANVLGDALGGNIDGANTTLRSLNLEGNPLNVHEGIVLNFSKATQRLHPTMKSAQDQKKRAGGVMPASVEQASENMEIFGSIFSTNRSILSMNLHNCNIDRDSCKRFAQHIQANETLVTLDLTKNPQCEFDHLSVIRNRLDKNVALMETREQEQKKAWIAAYSERRKQHIEQQYQQSLLRSKRLVDDDLANMCRKEEKALQDEVDLANQIEARQQKVASEREEYRKRRDLAEGGSVRGRGSKQGKPPKRRQKRK